MSADKYPSIFSRQTEAIVYITLISIIIHQTHYEKSDWSRAFNQFTIACELDMINAISAAHMYLSCQVQLCLVTKPLGVFSSETKWLNASLLFLRMNYVKNVL